jgi:hypothetical protein
VVREQVPEDIREFIHTMTGIRTATIAGYSYTIGRETSRHNRAWTWVIRETKIGESHPSQEIEVLDVQVGIRMAAEWAIERKNQLQNNLVKEQETKDEDVPVKDEEISPENREILDLLGSKNSWYKLSKKSK